ncbi:hypothetical protein LSH36_190g04023, partial [Paralvinella palmiformis]
MSSVPESASKGDKVARPSTAVKGSTSSASAQKRVQTPAKDSKKGQGGGGDHGGKVQKTNGKGHKPQGETQKETSKSEQNKTQPLKEGKSEKSEQRKDGTLGKSDSLPPKGKVSKVKEMLKGIEHSSEADAQNKQSAQGRTKQTDGRIGKSSGTGPRSQESHDNVKKNQADSLQLLKSASAKLGLANLNRRSPASGSGDANTSTNSGRRSGLDESVLGRSRNAETPLLNISQGASSRVSSAVKKFNQAEKTAKEQSETTDKTPDRNVEQEGVHPETNQQSKKSDQQADGSQRVDGEMDGSDTPGPTFTQSNKNPALNKETKTEPQTPKTPKSAAVQRSASKEPSERHGAKSAPSGRSNEDAKQSNSKKDATSKQNESSSKHPDAKTESSTVDTSKPSSKHTSKGNDNQKTPATDRMAQDPNQDESSNRLLHLAQKNEWQDTGISTLMLSVRENRLVISERLLDLGANVNQKAK